MLHRVWCKLAAQPREVYLFAHTVTYIYIYIYMWTYVTWYVCVLEDVRVICVCVCVFECLLICPMIWTTSVSTQGSRNTLNKKRGHAIHAPIRKFWTQHVTHHPANCNWKRQTNFTSWIARTQDSRTIPLCAERFGKNTFHCNTLEHQAKLAPGGWARLQLLWLLLWGSLFTTYCLAPGD